MKKTLVLLILTAGISTLAAQSEENNRPERPNPAEIFKTADVDKDGYLDLKELTDLRAKMPQGPRGNRGGSNADGTAPGPRAGGQGGPGGQGRGPMLTAEEMMAMMDKNKDGKLAPNEFTMGNRRGGPGGPEEGQKPRAKKPE